MGTGSPIEKGKQMKCRICGGTLRAAITDLPFKVSDRTIVILKRLPVQQCESCGEYAIADAVLEKVDMLLDKVDASVELEIIPYAA